MNDNNNVSRSNTPPFNNAKNQTELNNNNENLKIPSREKTGREVVSNRRNLSNRSHLSSPKSINTPFGPKNRTNNAVNNLQNNLSSTSTNLKNQAVKKGTEDLKKTAKPYAKAAGYAASFLQKRKEKQNKEKEESNSEESKNDSNDSSENDNDSDSTDIISDVTGKGSAKIKKMLPIIMIGASILVTILLFVAILSPLLNGYAWFYSIFNHNSNDAESYYIYRGDESGNLAKEKAFNDAIVGSNDGSVKGIIQEYKEKYGVSLDKYLLIATITYRYTAGNSDNLYTSDGTNDISDEELNNRLKDLEKSDNTETTETSENTIDYKDAEKKIAIVAALMVTKNGGSYSTDSEVGGTFYNTLIESEFLKTYYKDLLKDQEYETRKKLVDEIFEYANSARDLFEDKDSTVSGGVIGDTTIVHVQTCKYRYSYQTINGLEVYNNPPWNEGTEYPDYLSATDYIKGVMMGEVSDHITKEEIEGLKAFSIAALSFMLNDRESGFNLKSGEMYFPAGNCRQLTCSPTYGCSYLKGKTSGEFGTAFVGLNRFGSTTGQHPPLTEEQDAILQEVIDSVFGKIMVKKGVTPETYSGSKDTINADYYDSVTRGGCKSGYCLGQIEAMEDAKNGDTYEQILAKYYSSVDYDIINITEGLYFESTETYNGTINLNESFHYHQTDSPWGSQKLCGSESISGNGCNITSAAIAISLLTNQKITPETLNNHQSENKFCGPNTRPQMIMEFARMYGLNAVEIRKNNKVAVNNMLEKLSTGNYVAVVRLSSGSSRSLYPSSSGHYMTIVGVKTENGVNKVLVWNTIRTQDNRWVDVNDLMAILRTEYSFILIGR